MKTTRISTYFFLSYHGEIASDLIKLLFLDNILRNVRTEVESQCKFKFNFQTTFLNQIT